MPQHIRFQNGVTHSAFFVPSYNEHDQKVSLIRDESNNDQDYDEKSCIEKTELR